MHGILLADFSRAVTQTPIRYLLPLPYEQDAGFREVVIRYSKLGATTAGTLGVLSIIAVMLGYSDTGLGLSLSYDIVTQGHGGTLDIESDDREGGAFVVPLPADKSAGDAPSAYTGLKEEGVR